MYVDFFVRHTTLTTVLYHLSNYTKGSPKTFDSPKTSFDSFFLHTEGHTNLNRWHLPRKGHVVIRKSEKVI